MPSGHFLKKTAEFFLKVPTQMPTWVLFEKTDWVVSKSTHQRAFWVLVWSKCWVLSQSFFTCACSEPKPLIKSSFTEYLPIHSHQAQWVLFKELTKNSQSGSVLPQVHTKLIGYMVEYIVIPLESTLWKNSWWVAWVLIGHMWKNFVKELSGFDQKAPAGYFDGYFLKVFTMCLVGFEWEICFRNHHELTMYPLGKCPLAPSVTLSAMSRPDRTARFWSSVQQKLATSQMGRVVVRFGRRRSVPRSWHGLILANKARKGNGHYELDHLNEWHIKDMNHVPLCLEELKGEM